MLASTCLRAQEKDINRQFTASISLAALSIFCHGILALIPITDIGPNKDARAYCSSVSREEYNVRCVKLSELPDYLYIIFKTLSVE